MHTQGISKSRMLVVAVLSLILGTGVADASTFEVGVGDASCGNVSLGASPASGSWTFPTNGSGSSSANGFAVDGVLGGSSTATANGSQISATNNAVACYRTRFTVDDIIITGPTGPVSTQVSAHLEGTMTTSTSSGMAVAQIEARMIPKRFDGVNLASPTTFITTVTNSLNVDTTLVSPSFDAPVGQTFQVQMFLELEIHASDNVSNPGTVTTSTDFSNSMSFIEGAPVFSLPPGYTANSADGKIVDNVFVGGAGPATVPSLTGPAAHGLVLAMGTLSAYLAGAVRRARSRSESSTQSVA